MGARTVTSFGTYNDGATMIPRKRVLTTEPSAVTDDQQFCLEVENLLVSDFFHPILVEGDAAFHDLFYYYVNGRDMCGVVASEQVYIAVYAWCSALVNFGVGVYDAGAGAYAYNEVTATQTTPRWHGFDAKAPRTHTMDTDGTENTIRVGAAVLGWTAAEKVWVSGIGIFSGS